MKDIVKAVGLPLDQSGNTGEIYVLFNGHPKKPIVTAYLSEITDKHARTAFTELRQTLDGTFTDDEIRAVVQFMQMQTFSLVDLFAMNEDDVAWDATLRNTLVRVVNAYYEKIHPKETTN
ncbi:MAG: hypothetical protein HZA34_02225 [Candidatus Pacebacteria bacterium]|nr:hypothetical protein [Candidatus Paceibacterota bacterium]